MELVATTSKGAKVSMDVKEDHIFLQLGDGESVEGRTGEALSPKEAGLPAVDIFLDHDDITPAVREEALKARRSVEKAICAAANRLQEAILVDACSEGR